MPTAAMKFHSYAEIFPLLEGEVDQFAADKEASPDRQDAR
jgi:hypothetical protein